MIDNNNYKLSIIIPMYNSEKYIANCLDSILNSDLPKGEYEVIIVNDGSTDKCPLIAQKYVRRHNDFHYLTQENQGQSVARNKGIEACHGEYVWFIDSDDMISSKVMSAYIMLADSSFDILAFQLRIENEQGQFIRMECEQPNIPHDVIMTGRDAIIWGYRPSSVCSLWVRRRYLLENDFFFKIGITHQDVELSYRIFASSSKVIFMTHAIYIYILHPNSTSQSIDPTKKMKYLFDDIVVYQSFKKLAKQMVNDRELSFSIENRAQNVLFSLVYSLFCQRKEWKPLGINKAVINKMKKDNLYPLHGPFDSWKKRLMSYILNIEWLFC